MLAGSARMSTSPAVAEAGAQIDASSTTPRFVVGAATVPMGAAAQTDLALRAAGRAAPHPPVGAAAGQSGPGVARRERGRTDDRGCSSPQSLPARHPARQTPGDRVKRAASASSKLQCRAPSKLRRVLVRDSICCSRSVGAPGLRAAYRRGCGCQLPASPAEPAAVWRTSCDSMPPTSGEGGIRTREGA
jgi:hypothetical protein